MFYTLGVSQAVDAAVNEIFRGRIISIEKAVVVGDWLPLTVSQTTKVCFIHGGLIDLHTLKKPCIVKKKKKKRKKKELTLTFIAVFFLAIGGH